MENVIVIKNLSLPTQKVDKNLRVICLEKSGIEINAYNGAPMILIGQDNSRLLATRETREILLDELFVSKSALGWTIHGTFNQTRKNSNKPLMTYIVDKSKNTVRSERMDGQLHELVKSYFELESIGTSNKSSFDSEDSRALEILEKTCRFKENSWEVGLL